MELKHSALTTADIERALDAFEDFEFSIIDYEAKEARRMIKEVLDGKAFSSQEVKDYMKNSVFGLDREFDSNDEWGSYIYERMRVLESLHNYRMGTNK